MRRLHWMVGIGLALTLVLATTSSAAAQVYWRDYKHWAAVEPSRVDVVHGAGSYTYATALDRWRHWGARRTRAGGRIWANNCRPSCANGDYRPHRGVVKLSRPHRCGSRRLYGRVVFDFKRSHRYRDRRIKIDCQGYERW